MPAPLVIAPIIAFLFVCLRVFLVANIVGLIMRVAVAFGISVWLVEPVVDTIMSLMAGKFGILPPVAAAWMGFFNVDRYVGLILSAYGIQSAGNFILRTNK